MKRCTRIFSLLLAVLMCAGLLPLGALASDEAPAEETAAAEVLPVLDAAAEEPTRAEEVPAEEPARAEEVPAFEAPVAEEEPLPAADATSPPRPDYDIEIYTDNSWLATGDEFTLTIELKNNPGLNELYFILPVATEGMEVVDVSLPWDYSLIAPTVDEAGEVLTAMGNENGVIIVDYGDDLAEENYYGTGVLATVTLRLNSTLGASGAGFGFDELLVYDVDGNELDLTWEPCYVDFSEYWDDEPGGDSFDFSFGTDKTEVVPGEEFTLYAFIDRNPGLTNLIADITFDNTLFEVVSAVYDGVLPNIASTVYKDRITLDLGKDSAVEEFTETGYLAAITFRAKADAAPGSRAEFFWATDSIWNLAGVVEDDSSFYTDIDIIVQQPIYL